AESNCGSGGRVTLRVRGRLSCLVCVGGERTGVRGVAFLLLLGVFSLEVAVLFARFAALSSDDLASSNKCHALSSSGSLIAAGGVFSLFDHPDSLLVPRK